MENRKHYAAAIIAFVIWGFFSIPLRALKDYSAGEILYFRILFSLAILAVVIIGFKRKDLASDLKRLRSMASIDRRKVVLLTLAGGILLTVNWLIFIYIVNNVNIKTASFAYLVCPVVTAVLGFLLLKERLTRMQWFAVALCAVSLGMVGLSSWVELAYSFITALTYALYLISQRKNQGFDRIVVLAVQVSFALIILSCMFNFLVTEVPGEGHFYFVIVIIAAVFTVFPLFLNLFALNKINSATIGILMYLNPLFNFTMAFVVFHEKITLMQMAGYGVIVVALVLFNLQNLKRIQGSLASQKA